MSELIHPEVIYFTVKTCSPDWSITNNCHPFYGLVFIISGNTSYKINGVHYAAKAGDIIFTEPGSIRDAHTSGMSCVAIDFSLPKHEFINFPTLYSWGDFEEFHMMFQDLKFEWLQKQSGYKLKSQALVMLILYKLLYDRNKMPKNIHVENMKCFIMEHYTKNLTVANIAEQVNLNPVYCGALFKKIEGRTIAEFINQVRINKAVTLLESDEYTIGEVAEETGFIDIYYFSNMFKKTVGLSPSTYKKSKALKL